MNQSATTTPKGQQISLKGQQSYNQSYSQSQNTIIQKSNSHPPIEMETFAIGQPITKDGQPLMTPLLQMNSNISQNQNYIQSPTNNSRINLQITSSRQIHINSSLINQLRFEQFPDSNLPQTLYCFKCNKMVITQVEEDYGCGTYSVALGLCILFFPCTFIPFMQKQCKDYIHSCRECKTYLGKKVFLCRLC